jgi:trimethylamine--corrinoid protein Co-methyltransferase
MLTLMAVPWSGAQYIHYAFGLLERTATFCPAQAVMDDAHIGVIKRMLKPTSIAEEDKQGVLDLVREIMAQKDRTYMYHLPIPSREDVYVRYPLEHKGGGALRAAQERYEEIMERPRTPLPDEMRREIAATVPGVLPATWGE